MIRVAQEVHSDKDGDCFRACLASITELPDVPNWVEHEMWFTDLLGWLRERGWEMFTRPPDRPPTGYSIGVIWSPTFKGARHAVVAENGDLAWDPSPLRDEPGRVYGDWLYFVEVRPLATPAPEEAPE